MLNKCGSFKGESVVKRMNPVIKLLGLFVYVLLCFLKFERVLFICNISLVFLLILLSNINMMRYLKVLWYLKYAIIFVYVLLYRFGMELDAIHVVIFKFVFFILYKKVIFLTTTREELGKGVGIVFHFINMVGLSLKEIQMFFTNLFVFWDCFHENFRKKLLSGEIKGIVFSHCTILIKMKMVLGNFKSVWNDTRIMMEQRKIDLKYRMYDKKVKKKYKYRNKLCVFDIIFVILNIGMIGFYIWKVR